MPKAGRTISAGIKNTVNLSKRDRKKMPEYPRVPIRSTTLSMDANNISNIGFSEKVRSFVGIDDINIHPGSHFKASGSFYFGQNFNMPVIKIVSVSRVHRRGVDEHIETGIAQCFFNFLKNKRENIRQLVVKIIGQLFKVGLAVFHKNSYFIRIFGNKWAESDKLFVLEDYPVSRFHFPIQKHVVYIFFVFLKKIVCSFYAP